MSRSSNQHAVYRLTDVRDAIDAERINFENNAFSREKNQITLKALGLSVSEAVGHIRSLRGNQFEGISKKTGYPPADVYKKTINGERVYIKFFLEGDLVVLSFHKDEPRRKR